LGFKNNKESNENFNKKAENSLKINIGRGREKM
jgi:hypothetical protein